ncbi:MAG TPA: hypothetical protein ENN13_02510 [Candidatus Altiarchaeales archaeon]|nr:hypothetical protein [Candidatus Altiarchaeales archaeon]
MSSWDSLYTLMTSKVNYKTLMIIPPIVSILLLIVLLANGLELGLDFKGGTWIEVLTPNDFSSGKISELEDRLSSLGFGDVDGSVGWDIDTGLNKIVITTTTVLSEEDSEGARKIIGEYAGALREDDTITLKLLEGEWPPIGFSEKLNSHLKQRVDVTLEEDTLTVRAISLDGAEAGRILSYYLGREVEVEVFQKNYNQKTVGATLGDTFRRQALKAVFLAFVLMTIVIFIAFKDPVPSLAVMLAASCDIIITAGAMSILRIRLEPASLAALLMLIGYSVDSDILLTVRTLKRRQSEIDERINDAMKTGLTMTGTTLAVMVVVYLVSTTLTHIDTLSNIASILLIGLVADLFTTWFTNAGLMKWYLEGGGKKKYGRGGRR